MPATVFNDIHDRSLSINRAKQLFVDNSEQVEEMIRILGCSVQDESLYHV